MVTGWRLLVRWALVLVLCGLGLASSPATATAPEVEWARPEAVAVIALSPVPPAVEVVAPDTPDVPVTPSVPEPVPRMAPEERIGSIPVLMYHEIGDLPNNNYVRLQEFEAQMAWLADNGYTSVTMAEVYRHLNDFEPLPPKPVVISFDDGYLTFYTLAVPILQRHSFVAINFIITGMVGWTEHMDWDQVRSVSEVGMEIGSHSISHVDFRHVNNERAERELVQSKQELETNLGVPVHFFGYPSGRYASHTPDLVQQAGYWGAVTTMYGPVTPDQNPFLWPRVRVLRGETTASFAAKVRQASVELP